MRWPKACTTPVSAQWLLIGCSLIGLHNPSISTVAPDWLFQIGRLEQTTLGNLAVRRASSSILPLNYSPEIFNINIEVKFLIFITDMT